jgi:Domain of Unknown Function (DUF1206)
MSAPVAGSGRGSRPGPVRGPPPDRSGPADRNRGGVDSRSRDGARRQHLDEAEKGLTLLGRVGLAGRTGFYMILTGITIRIALFGGPSSHQADAQGALTLISRPTIGKVAIGAVALGFVLFGVDRLIGSVQDTSVSRGRRIMTALQGAFYLALAYVPASFLAGNHQVGSQQGQQNETAKLLRLPGGRAIVIGLGVVMMAVCAQQIRGAVQQDFRDGLDLERAHPLVRRLVGVVGVLGITARALVFLPIGIFLIVSSVLYDPNKSYGTDSELLRLSGRAWGVFVLALVALGLAVFVVFSGIETRYRKVISAK